MPEAWDKSKEKAKELRIEHWGTLEEVKVMAEPIRKASIAFHKGRTGECA